MEHHPFFRADTFSNGCFFSIFVLVLGGVCLRISDGKNSGEQVSVDLLGLSSDLDEFIGQPDQRLVYQKRFPIPGVFLFLFQIVHGF